MYPFALTASYCPAVVDGPLEDMTVGEALRRAAADSPARPALTEITAAGVAGRRWTFGALLADAEALARVLLTRHAPGARIAIWAPNVPEWVLLELAAGLAGITIVTINPSFQPREVHFVLAQSQASALYLVPSHRGNPMRQIAESLAPELPGLETIVDLADREALYRPAGPLPGGALPAVDPLAVAQIQYTSGTTGFPKGALLHHRGITNNARLHAARIGGRAGDTWLNFMPLFHTGGCAVQVLGALQTRGHLVLAAQFDAGLMIDAIERERVNLVLGVPTMIRGMLEMNARQPRDLTSVHTVIVGGAMVPPELVTKTREVFGCDFQIIYGQTETSPVLTCVWKDDSLDDITGTVGQAIPHTELSIRDPKTNETVPIGGIGEICARGYCTMHGYNDNPAATRAALDEQGWLHTGDLGTMDARGYVRVTGRLKEMIIRGGENLFPAEIENAMLEHPAIADCAVVGLPDPTWGEVVACFIRPAGHERPGMQELAAFCRERLSPQKTPARWIFVETWPTTASGKIQKFALQEGFARGEYEAL
ncbi:MAG: AMP-binding protein [Gammaproteobacteria bacterium]|nr:AMP-binding protein [Gammaproteobacteria bacterium]MBI5618672.1 AMP-binding protein [Gammaproteobacteria bacterium]